MGVEACAPQQEMFSRALLLGVAVTGGWSVVVGFLLTHAGLWVSRILAGWVVVLLLVLLLANSNYHFPIDLAPIGIPFVAKSIGKW